VNRESRARAAINSVLFMVGTLFLGEGENYTPKREQGEGLVFSL
jgi:hypothetical protein